MVENQSWYANAVFYHIDIRAFQDSNGDGYGDLPGLIARLGYLQDLGVDCLRLLPIFPAILHGDDYGITDYYSVKKAFGELEDLDALIQAAHERNIRVILDLNINHTADRHPWFQISRSDPQSPYRNYYLWSDTDHPYAAAGAPLGKESQSNWHPDTSAKQYYWSRFSPALPELNYDSLDLQKEIMNIIRFWLGHGLDGLCLEGLPYLYEREGTDCLNLPETHQFLKTLRAYIDQDYPGRILLGAFDQPQRVLAPYFGSDDELHMVQDGSLGARILMAMTDQNGGLVKRIAEGLVEVSVETQWLNQLCEPEGIWLDRLSPEDQTFLVQTYAPNQHPEASQWLARRLAPMMKNDQRRIRLLYALLFSLPGAPAVFYGDEIGVGEKLDLPAPLGLNLPMPWDETRGAGFSKTSPDQFYAPLTVQPPFDYRMLNVTEQEADPQSLLNFMKDLIAVRRDHPEIAKGALEWVDTDNPAVAAFVRRLEDKALFAVFNLADRTAGARIPREIRQQHRMDLLGGYLRLQPDLTNVTLKPYQFAWFVV